jgi:hypothetical protein
MSLGLPGRPRAGRRSPMNMHEHLECYDESLIAHAMRNELVEELIVEGEAKVMQNRTGSPEDSVKPARGRAKQAAERKK